MSENLRAEMKCLACGKEGEHELLYVGRILARTKCCSCGHVVEHEHKDLVPTYIKDLEHRIVTKPFRMLRRARKERTKFIKNLPKSTLQQPSKFWDDFKTLFRRSK